MDTLRVKGALRKVVEGPAGPCRATGPGRSAEVAEHGVDHRKQQSEKRARPPQGPARSRADTRRGGRAAGPPAISTAQTAARTPSTVRATSASGLNAYARRQVAMQQRSPHPGAAAQRALPTGQCQERARHTDPGGAVQRAKGQAAGEQAADDREARTGHGSWGGNRGGDHVVIVPQASAPRQAGEWTGNQIVVSGHARIAGPCRRRLAAFASARYNPDPSSALR